MIDSVGEKAIDRVSRPRSIEATVEPDNYSSR